MCMCMPSAVQMNFELLNFFSCTISILVYVRARIDTGHCMVVHTACLINGKLLEASNEVFLWSKVVRRK